MNYDSVISRTRFARDISDCIHGLDKNSCGYCNGISLVKKRIVKDNEVEAETINQYEDLKAHFKNYQEVWNEDEFFVVYANLKDVIGTRAEKRAIYKTAIELSRTLGAINWAKEHLFSKKDYHRGKIVVEFRKLFGLDKGD
jgi:hypothetical protein